MLADKYLEGALQHVPEVDLVFNGDCAQALGLDLPIAVINLAHRTDRWQAVSNRMAAIGLNKLIKVPAIEGARLCLEAISPLLGQPIPRIVSGASPMRTTKSAERRVLGK